MNDKYERGILLLSLETNAFTKGVGGKLHVPKGKTSRTGNHRKPDRHIFITNDLNRFDHHVSKEHVIHGQYNYFMDLNRYSTNIIIYFYTSCYFENLYLYILFNIKYILPFYGDSTIEIALCIVRCYCTVNIGIIFYIYIYSTILVEGDRLTFTIEIALCRSGMIGTNYNEGYKILY